MNHLIVCLFVGLMACSGAKAPTPQETKAGPLPVGGMVAAANPLAVEAGLDMLRQGGSALDAAVAVQAVLGLVEPQSSGLGGGSFLVYYDANSGKVSSFDGREAAPAGANADMFLSEDGKALGYLEAINSGRAVGVPGAIDMLAVAHSEYGALPWEALFAPGIKLAEEGFTVSPRLAALLKGYGHRAQLDRNAAARAYFFLPDGSALPEGYLRKNPDYAATLRAISANPRALLEGPIAADIVAAAHLDPRPGTLTLADLKGYHAQKREAVCRPFKNRQICSAPPPSSGGIAINSIMGILENIHFSDAGAKDPQNWHYFIEAQRLAYADRDLYVADSAFVTVPLKGLLNSAYLKNRAALISPTKAIFHAEAGPPKDVFSPEEMEERGKDNTDEVPGTSHFSIVDGVGNVVSMTTTVESAFGSKRFTNGFLLNNQLTDFARYPYDEAGKPLANAPAPGKHPRSSMSPTLVLDKDGGFYMATGSPGGNSIIAYTAKTLVGVLAWGLSPQQAIDLPNVVARGDVTRIEGPRADPALIPALVAMGHQIKATRGENSGLHIILAGPDGVLIGGADPRREGVALEP
ncbi:MAG: gamma-glutamyltransferase [Robiginitomaculum sp.]|nr:MAG: gamma-glutamyltransferase [Robiginitomaculum sp.]